MIYISHRGNVRGKVPQIENHPTHIKYALGAGYNVEVDLWLVNDRLVLGHDEPLYEITDAYLYNQDLWFHAKNVEAFEYLMNKKVRCFWHTDEDFVLTSKGDIWVYPDKPLIDNSIAVLPEITNYTIDQLKNCYAICSDNIIFYKRSIDGNTNS